MTLLDQLNFSIEELENMDSTTILTENGYKKYIDMDKDTTIILERDDKYTTITARFNWGNRDELEINRILSNYDKGELNKINILKNNEVINNG